MNRNLHKSLTTIISKNVIRSSGNGRSGIKCTVFIKYNDTFTIIYNGINAWHSFISKNDLAKNIIRNLTLSFLKVVVFVESVLPAFEINRNFENFCIWWKPYIYLALQSLPEERMTFLDSNDHPKSEKHSQR